MALVAVPEDHGIVASIAASLRDAGISVVDAAGEPSLDGLVVLISPSSVVNSDWQQQASTLQATRVVPVRTDSAIGAADVPERVQRLNWVDWVPSRAAATLGYVIAGLYTNPDLHRAAQELAQHASAWDEAGRSHDLLVPDLGRAERMRDQLEALEATGGRTPDASIRAYVEASVARARRIRRRRRVLRAAAALLLLTAVSAVTKAVPDIRARSDINRAAIVTAGNEDILVDQPEWAAANAAALLIHGTATQRALGRLTLSRALHEPWAYSAVNYVDSIRSLVSFDRGRTGAALAYTNSRAKTGFVLLDIPGGKWIAKRTLPDRYEAIEVQPDDQTAIVVGDGIGKINLRTGELTRIVEGGDYVAVSVGTTMIAATTRQGDVHLLDSNGAIRTKRRYIKVLDVSEPSRGQAQALAVTSPGRIGIVDVRTGRVRASASTRLRAPTGSLNPEGTQALVEGADGQYWRLRSKQSKKPTGIHVPVSVTDIAWTRGNRVVVTSESERGQVILLPRGQALGHVCWGSPNPGEIRVDRRADVLSCGGTGAAYWRLPSATRSSGAPDVSTAKAHERAGTAVESRGSRVRISRATAAGVSTSKWLVPLGSLITAVSVSPDGTQVAVGSVGGDVATLAATPSGVTIVSLWSGPGAAPITGIGWDRGPVASTTLGQHWTVPPCPRCETDRGLLAAARLRNTGCLSERQLQWVDETARRRIGVRTCPRLLLFQAP